MFMSRKLFTKTEHDNLHSTSPDLISSSQHTTGDSQDTMKNKETIGTSNVGSMTKCKSLKDPRMAKEVGEDEKNMLMEKYCKKFPSLVGNDNSRRTDDDSSGRFISCGFASAGSGKKLTVSAAALQRAVRLVDDCTGDLISEQYATGSHGNCAMPDYIAEKSALKETKEASKMVEEERSHEGTHQLVAMENYGWGGIEMEKFLAFSEESDDTMGASVNSTSPSVTETTSGHNQSTMVDMATAIQDDDLEVMSSNDDTSVVSTVKGSCDPTPDSTIVMSPSAANKYPERIASGKKRRRDPLYTTPEVSDQAHPKKLCFTPMVTNSNSVIKTPLSTGKPTKFNTPFKAPQERSVTTPVQPVERRGRRRLGMTSTTVPFRYSPDNS